jgi:hypothetical protein
VCACRCHIILSNLRKPGEKDYKIPSGFLFNYITCANYFAEIWGWILFTIGTHTLTAGLFTAAGAFQMADWARGKHKRLVKVSSLFALCCAAGLAQHGQLVVPVKLERKLAYAAQRYGRRTSGSAGDAGVSDATEFKSKDTCCCCNCVFGVCSFLTARTDAPSTPSVGSCSHPCCRGFAAAKKPLVASGFLHADHVCLTWRTHQWHQGTMPAWCGAPSIVSQLLQLH